MHKTGDIIVIVNDQELILKGKTQSPYMATSQYRQAANARRGRVAKVLAMNANYYYVEYLPDLQAAWVDTSWCLPANNEGIPIMPGDTAPKLKDYNGFCDACGGHEIHRIGCPPSSMLRKR